MADLTSKTTARIIDVIGEGEVEVIGGDKGIYLNKTQYQDNGGSYNFEGVRTIFRTGTLNQSPMPGYRNVETQVTDGREIKNVTPVNFNITDAEVDAVSLSIGVNGLSDTDSDDGDMHPYIVVVEIYRRPSGGAFTKVGTVTIDGKTRSQYERQKRVALPPGGFPYTIELRRVTADATNPDIVDDTFFRSYKLIYDLKLRYPYTALVGLEVDAEKFGNQFPERRYKVRRLNVKYPSNYNLVTRAYTGIWDGTFLTGACRNPAWILADLMTNPVYGLGDTFNFNNIDKFGLYTIAQYCDGMVPNGQGGTEPRYEFNGSINSREDAARVLDSIASVFRGMIYWQSGSVAFAHDAPTTIAKDVVPANVINGEFIYAGSALKARHSVVTVAWNDNTALGELSYEIVQRDDLIAKFGYREKPIGAIGCTSRGQARRVGEWLLDTEANETELVTYRAALDHADVRPGQLIRVFDPKYAGARMGGRIVAVAGTLRNITIDAPINIQVGQTYEVNITMPDGTIETRNLTNVAGNNQTVLTWGAALPQQPVPDAIWTVNATNVNGRPFRVMAVYERSGVFEINAIFHDVTKYARIERNRQIDTPDYNLPGRLLPPASVGFVEFTKDNGDDYVAAITVSIGPNNDARAYGFEYQIKDGNDKGWQVLRRTRSHSFDYAPAPKGLTTVRVRSYAKDSLNLNPSQWVTNTYTVLGYAFPSPATSLSANGENRRIVLEFPENPSPKFKRWVIYGSQVNNFTTATIIDYNYGRKRWAYDHLIPGDIWYFWIVAQDKKGNNSERFPTPPSNVNGVSGVVGYITETDDDPTTLPAPTGLTLSQTRKEGRDGTIVHRVHMTCNAPAGANAKTNYIYYVDNGTDPEFTIVSKDRAAEFVATWNTTYNIRVLAQRANGTLGNISTALPITTVKKPSTTLPTPGGLTVNPGIKNNAVLWNSFDENTYRDYDFTGVWWNTSGVTPTPGVTAISRKVTGTGFLHENLPITNYSYWIAHKDKSGNWTPLAGPMTGTPVRVLDDDVDPTGLPAPTAFTLGQITERDLSGTIRKYVTLTCTPPAGANAKTYYVYTVSSNLVGDWPFSVVSDGPTTRFIGKIGVTYTINARAIKFSNAKGTPTADLTITPVKKVGDIPIPTGLAVTSKNGDNRIEFDDVNINTYPDYAESVLWRNQTGVTPTPGVTTPYKKGRAGYFSDPKVVKGATWQYWVCHYDTSGNPSPIAGPVGISTLGVGNADVEDNAITDPKFSGQLDFGKVKLQSDGNLFRNPGFIGGGSSGWNMGANTSVVTRAAATVAGAPSAYVARFVGASAFASIQVGLPTDVFEVSAGETFAARFFAAADGITGTGNISLFCGFANASGDGVYTYIAVNQNLITLDAAGTWQEAVGLVTAPATVNGLPTAGMILIIQMSNTITGGTAFVAKPRIRRATTNDMLTLNAVAEGNLQDDSISTGKVKNRAINAAKTKYNDPENLISVGDFDQFAGGDWDDLWAFGGGTNTGSNTGNFWLWNGDSESGSQSFAMDNKVTGGAAGGTIPQLVITYLDYIPVKALKPYAWELAIRTTDTVSAIGCYYRMNWYTRAKVLISSTDVIGNGPIPTAWTTYEGFVTPPATAAYCRPQIYHNSNANTRYLIVDRMVFRKAKGAELTAPGTMIEDKIADNAVTPRKTKRIDQTNLIRNADCDDVTLWNGVGGVSTAATAQVSESANVLSIPATTAQTDLYTDIDIPVKAGKKYYVNGFSGPSNGVSCTHYIQVLWYSMNAAGVKTYISTSTVGVATGTVVTEKEGIVTAPANARRAQLVCLKAASAGAANLILYGPVFRRAAANDMIPDGDIIEDKLGDNAVTPRKTKRIDSTNLLRDPDCQDIALWTGTGGVTTAGTAQVSESTNALSIPATTAVSSINSLIDIPVKAGKKYYVDGFAGPSNGVSCTHDIRIYWFSMDAVGVVTYLSASIIGSTTGTTVTEKEGIVTAPANARRAQLVANKAASAAAANLVLYGPVFRRAAANDMIPDGDVTDLKGDPTPPGKPNAAPALVAVGSYNKDGAIDGGLTATVTAPIGGRGVKKYRIEIYRSLTLGTPGNNATGYTLFDTIERRALVFDIRGNSNYYYKLRAIPITANDVEGTPSDYTNTGVQPLPASAPTAPTNVHATSEPLAFEIFWDTPIDPDYLFTEMWYTASPFGVPLVGETPHATSISGRLRYYTGFDGTYFGWVRHVNRSGLKSAWVKSLDTMFPDLLSGDAGGAPNKIEYNSIALSNIANFILGVKDAVNSPGTIACPAATVTQIEILSVNHGVGGSAAIVYAQCRNTSGGTRSIDVELITALGVVICAMGATIVADGGMISITGVFDRASGMISASTTVRLRLTMSAAGTVAVTRMQSLSFAS